MEEIEVMEVTNYTYIHFTYNHSTQEFRIIGTHTASTPNFVGGIYIPVDKNKLLTPYIGLTILSAVVIVTVVYSRKRKQQ